MKKSDRNNKVIKLRLQYVCKTYNRQNKNICNSLKSNAELSYKTFHVRSFGVKAVELIISFKMRYW